MMPMSLVQAWLLLYTMPVRKIFLHRYSDQTADQLLDTVIWPTMIGALLTTDVQKTGWLFCAVGGGLLLGQILGGTGVRFLPRMKI